MSCSCSCSTLLFFHNTAIVFMENLKELSILSLSPNAAAQEDGVYYACVWPFMGFDRQSEQSETAAFAGV